jgi:dihydroflavonol-4-reductase
LTFRFFVQHNASGISPIIAHQGGRQMDRDLGAKVLVTGADGLLGSHLTRKLIERGFSVRALLHPKSDSPTLDGLPIETIKADLCDCDALLPDAIRGCQYVFHCAAITDLWADSDLVWNVNFEATKTLLNACATAGIDRLVFTGSASSFTNGTLENPGDETNGFSDQYRGVPYMESKHKAMEAVREYVKQQRGDAIIVAPTFMLGDLDPRPSSGELIRQFIVRGMRFTSSGGRNFAYAPDVADAMIAATTKGQSGGSYLAGGRNLPYLDFFARVAKIAGARPPKAVLPNAAVLLAGAMGSVYSRVSGRPAPLNWTTAKLAGMGTYYTSQKAIDELGMPQTPVEIGIEKTIAGLREFGHIPQGNR